MSPGELEGPPPEQRQRPGGRRDTQGIRVAAAEPDLTPSRTVLSAYVENEPGVLASVSGLFQRRQFNIESLTVGPTQNDGYSRITMVLEEPAPEVDQAKAQLQKLLPVVDVCELDDDAVASELVLVKVDGDRPDEVQAVTEMYGGETLDAGPDTITIQLTDDKPTIDRALAAYEQFGIEEIARTGQAALARGATETATVEETHT